KHLIVDQSNEGMENMIIVLTWLRDRNLQVSSRNLDLALSNSLNSGQRRLHFRPEAVPENFGRHTGKSFESWAKDDSNREYIGGRKNHALNPKLQAEVPKSVQDSAWKQKAESVVGNRHSETAMIKKLFVTDSSGNIDWRQTYEKRSRAAAGQPRI